MFLIVSCDCLQLALGPATMLTLKHVLNSYFECCQNVSTGMSLRGTGMKEEIPEKVGPTEKGTTGESCAEQEFADDLKRGGFVFITDCHSGKNNVWFWVHSFVCLLELILTECII